LRIVVAARVCRQNLGQQLDGFIGSPGNAVNLRQAGQPIDRARLQAQSMLVGCDRLRIPVGQTRGVSQQKPELRIVGSGLGCPLRITQRCGVVAPRQRLLGRPGQTGILDVLTPAERLRCYRRRARLGRRLCCAGRGDGVGLGHTKTGECKNDTKANFC
jgi:hypothetical protein